RLRQLDGDVEKALPLPRDERPGVAGSDVEIELLAAVGQSMRGEEAVEADEVKEAVQSVEDDAARAVASVGHRLAGEVVEPVRAAAVCQHPLAVLQHGGGLEGAHERRAPA